MENVIEVKKKKKSFNNHQVLNNVSISVKNGEIFGLLGANGAGKSTLIDCILGTKNIDSGTVALLGMNPIKERKKLFEKVGVQFQETKYPDKMLVYELCEETESLYKEALNYKELLKTFGIYEKTNSPISELSGGQKQKLFIVLALIPNPKVMFLDELTTGLDPKARREVWKALQKLKNQGIAIFLVSHYMDEVEKLCDKIAILKNGKICFYGTVQEAIKQSPYEKLEDTYLWYSGEEESNEGI